MPGSRVTEAVSQDAARRPAGPNTPTVRLAVSGCGFTGGTLSDASHG